MRTGHVSTRRRATVAACVLAAVGGSGLITTPVGAQAAYDTTPGVSSGGYSNLVLNNDGTVWGFGSNSTGQLGGTASGAPNPTPTAIAGVSGVRQISSNEFHSVALLNDGTLTAWGTNEHGELGNPANTGLSQANPPTAVTGITGAVAVSAGVFHTAVLDGNGEVWTFGDNFFGQLGRTNGSGANPTPTKIAGLTDVAAIEAGGFHTMVLRNDGTVWTVGRNHRGQLGVSANSGGNVATDALVQVPGVTDVVAIAAGQDHSAALRADGTVWTWGSNSEGQLGRTANGTDNPTPAQVAGLSDVVALSADEINTLALRRDGTVWGMGGNARGQLGTGSTFPGPVAGLTEVSTVAAGQEHSLLSDISGKLWALGRNNVGQMGVSTSSGTDAVNDTPLELGLVVPRVTANTPAPRRLLDTRTGQTTVDGQQAGGGALAAGSTTELVVTGRGGVPAGATSVVLNLTVINPTGSGFLTAFPCGTTRPLASNLNYRAGQTVANVTVAKVGTAGKVCLYNEGAATDLAVDADRFNGAGAAFVPLTPARLADSRTGETTVDGQQAGFGRLAAGSTTEVTVAGRGGVAAGAKAAVLNLTVANAGGLGFLTLFPCGSDRPLASNVNYAAGTPVANVAVSALGTGGKVCIYNEGAATDLIVDVTAAHLVASSLRPLTPARLLDTRSGATTVDGVGLGAGARNTGDITEVVVAGRGGVAYNLDQVSLNVTVTAPTGGGFLTVYPCGTPRPTASTLNYTAGQTVANASIVKAGLGGKVCIYNEGATAHVLADVTAYNTLNN